MVAPRGAPWASYTHVPYDKWHRYSLHRGSNARASMFMFGVTAEGHTVTLRVKDVEWPVYFRLHDTDGRPFSDGQVHKLQALLCTKCRDNSLVVTTLERYQTSGFVRDETAVGPTDRPVRKKLLFGRVMFTSTVAFQTCKRENEGLAELYGDLWRPEELRVAALGTSERLELATECACKYVRVERSSDEGGRSSVLRAPGSVRVEAAAGPASLSASRAGGDPVDGAGAGAGTDADVDATPPSAGRMPHGNYAHLDERLAGPTALEATVGDGAWLQRAFVL